MIIFKSWTKKITDNPTVNPLRLINFGSRIRSIFFFGFNLYLFVSAFGNSEISFYLYFAFLITDIIFDYIICCMPMPPCKSKIRQMIDNAKEKLEGIFSPEPCPIPIKFESF